MRELLLLRVPGGPGSAFSAGYSRALGEEGHVRGGRKCLFNPFCVAGTGAFLSVSISVSVSVSLSIILFQE